MSAISVILLATAGTAVGLGVAVLHTARRMRGELAELRADLARRPVPAARPAPGPEEIRAAVTEALAAERERELAEARAYWAEHDARGGDGPGALLDAHLGTHLDYDVPDEADDELLDALLERYLLSDGVHRSPAAREGGPLPRQQDGVSALDAADAAGIVDAVEAARAAHAAEPESPQAEETGGSDAPGEPEETGSPEDHAEPAELAAARRRHPSHPGYTLTGEPVGEQQRTADRLAWLAESRTPLADVQPGPLGTLDVFRFADGTTMCLAPSHQDVAERLAAAVRAGQAPVLMGGSGISGAYALTFSCGEENLYVLADRVVTTPSSS